MSDETRIITDTSTLTDKQQVWIEEYLICWNATEAARKAGYESPRMSGHDNLTKPYIRNLIVARLAEKKMSADEALARLSALAKADLGDFLSVQKHSGTAIVDLANAEAEGKLFLLKKYKETKYGTEVELHDPMRALELIARHHGVMDANNRNLIELPDEAVALMDELGISKSELMTGIIGVLRRAAAEKDEKGEYLVIEE